MSQTKYYEEKLVEGLEYQDFVAEKLYHFGLPLFNYASKKYQIEYGENKLGVEIKFDQKFEKTRNLYIETAEKTRPEIENYSPSGIYRNDNTWLYVQGNKKIFFIFSKKFLRQLFETGKYKEIEIGMKTSKGFLMPNADAEKYSAKIWKNERGA